MAPRIPKPGRDLASLRPDLAKQAHGWDPTTVTAGSGKKLDWKCSLSHVWPAKVTDRNSGKSCPFCSGNQVLAGFNDLATTRPDLAAQAHGWDPTTVTQWSGRRLEWQCALGHAWSVKVRNRSNGNGCRICSGNQVLAGFNDLATVNPSLAKQAHGWDPTTVTAGSGKKLDWKCSLGHIWPSTVDNRTNGNGCAVCSGHKVLTGFNDLATTHPDLAAQAHGWDPTTVTYGSKKTFEWECSLSHNWSAQVYARVAGNGCSICAGKKVLVGYNDLATTDPKIAAQAHGWDPTTVTAGSNKKRKWLCEFGHDWTVAVCDRRNCGCPSCAESGFNPSKPGWLYLIESIERDMLQIGVTNVPDQRLKKHASGGFEVIEVMGPFKIGQIVKDWESDILKYLRSHGAIIARDAGIEKFDGYKESWLRASFPVTSLKQLQAIVLDEESGFGDKVA